MTGQPLAVVLGRKWRIDAAYQLANLDAVDVEIGQIAQLAEATRLAPAPSWCSPGSIGPGRYAPAGGAATRLRRCYSPGRPPRKLAGSTCPARPAARISW